MGTQADQRTPVRHARTTPPDSTSLHPPSPLELLHPDGVVGRVFVHGTGDARALAPTGNVTSEAPADVVLLSPSPGERRDRAWVSEAARVASSIAQDGLLVVPSPSRRLRVELAAVGLGPETRLLHLPDVPRSRYVLPLQGRAAQYALRRVVPLHAVKRVAARALALPGAPSVGATSAVFRRPGARPLLAWLCAFGASGPPCTAIMARSWRPTGAMVVHRFGAGAAPDAIAKVGGGAAREARALRAVGPAARGASADVPTLLAQRSLDGLPVVIETPVAGSPAPRLLRGAPSSAQALMRAIARWLAEWNSGTAVRRRLKPADADRHALGPAKRLSPLIGDGGAYLSRIKRMCDQCVGRVVPFVAAHNDLTAANVLLDERGGLGVVDWEMAAPECLPLGDLVYAAADFAAAVDEYRDRPAAFAACFEPSGSFADLTGELLRDAAGSLALDAEALELCVQACWLHHADNERREAGIRQLPGRPFLAILKRAAVRPVA